MKTSGDKKFKDSFNVAQSTHFLSCAHAIGAHRRQYRMKCVLIKEMDCGTRSKIVVFGDRNWANSNDKKSIRYVDNYRITTIK